jgi:predicted HTH transcriptional regulator
MKIRIPIIGNKNGHPVVDDFFENICNVANINTGTIIGCPSNNIEDRARPFILIKDKVIVQKKYEPVQQEILDIYPDRAKTLIVYFFEVDIDENKLDLLTDEEIKLIS